MTRKVYQLNHFQLLDTYILVNGKKKLILFRGGSLKPKINGKFATTDPAEIAVMDEGAKRPGAAYRCILSDTVPDDKPKKVPEQKVDKEPALVETTMASAGMKVVPEINSVKDARNYLVENVKGYTISKLPNMTAVKNAAAKNNILFPNLP